MDEGAVAPKQTSIIRNKINDTVGFKYDNKSHTYTLNGIKLLSGTELISKYVKPVDFSVISEMSANKNKREGKSLSDAKDIRRYWRMLGEHASSLGTAGHAFCLLYWLNKDTKPVTVLDHNAKKMMDNLMQKFEIVEMELPRGNKRHCIGYTIDVLLRDKISGEMVLADFKFSSKFTNEQYKALKGRPASLMLAPFNEFRDIAFDKGSIQLELYSQLLEEDTGIHIDLKLLIHVDGLGETFYEDKGYKVYVTKDCKELVKEMIVPLDNSDSIVNLL